MRWVALALLAVNLGLLGHHLMTTDSPVAPSERPAAADEVQLVLLSELPPGKSLAPRAPLVSGELPAGVDAALEGETATVESPAAEATAPETRCYRIGSFDNKKIAARVKLRVEQAGAETMPIGAEHFESTRYWVLLPPLPTRAKALAVVKSLKKAGVKDYYLIPSGENRNAVSLGVFSSREASRRRLADVAALKLKVRVEEVKYSSERFFFDLKWPRDSAPVWDVLLPKGIEATARECRSIS